MIEATVLGYEKFEASPLIDGDVAVVRQRVKGSDGGVYYVQAHQCELIGEQVYINIID